MCRDTLELCGIKEGDLGEELGPQEKCELCGEMHEVKGRSLTHVAADGTEKYRDSSMQYYNCGKNMIMIGLYLRRVLKRGVFKAHREACEARFWREHAAAQNS